MLDYLMPSPSTLYQHIPTPPSIIHSIYNSTQSVLTWPARTSLQVLQSVSMHSFYTVTRLATTIHKQVPVSFLNIPTAPLLTSTAVDLPLKFNMNESSPPKDVPVLPLVFCHGLMGFDQLGPFHYWRGIRDYLEMLGCKVIVMKVPAISSIEERANVLRDGLLDVLEKGNILNETVEEGESDDIQNIESRNNKHIKKVHLIGHSMAGLDARYFVSQLGGSAQTFSLTTIGTPHRGTYMADWTVEKVMRRISGESFLRSIGINTEAFYQLTRRYMEEEFNPTVLNHPDVQYYSISGGGISSVPSLSPMRLFHHRLQEVEGANDGVVSVRSAQWGEFLGTVPLDHLELMNWNIFKDVRFMYSGLASFLAQKEREMGIGLPVDNRPSTSS